jgi:hypothetical protein
VTGQPIQTVAQRQRGQVSKPSRRFRHKAIHGCPQSSAAPLQGGNQWRRRHPAPLSGVAQAWPSGHDVKAGRRGR